jgi:hypothetical protein
MNSWQVAYVWAFIVKFNQKERIRGLESAEEYVSPPCCGSHKTDLQLREKLD